MSFPPRRAITVVPGIAQLRTGPGPYAEEYVFPLDVGRVYRWSPGALAVDDGRTALLANGGFPGAYLLVREAIAPAAVGFAPAQVITAGAGDWFTIAAGTLTADVAILLDVTGAGVPGNGPVAGDTVEVTRLDLSAYEVTLTNGGPLGGGVTLPGALRSYAAFTFDGADWRVRRSGLML